MKIESESLSLKLKWDLLSRNDRFWQLFLKRYDLLHWGVSHVQLWVYCLSPTLLQVHGWWWKSWDCPGRSQYQPEISTLEHRYWCIIHILHLLTTGQFSVENWFSRHRPTQGDAGAGAAEFYSFMFPTVLTGKFVVLLTNEKLGRKETFQ